MQMGFELEQSQKQTQKLSQKMMQAINVLQMNTESLDHYMTEAYINNPVLEKKVNHQDDWSGYSKQYHGQNYRKDYYGVDLDKENRLIASVRELTYIDDLLIQWHTKKLDHRTERIGEWIIHHINHKGYLDMELSELTGLYDIDADESEAIIEKVHELEPPGIGSRNLEERLIIQLRRRQSSTPILEKLIMRYLQELGDKKWQKICKKLKISMMQLKAYLAVIRKLEPILNVEDYSGETQYIKPQIKVVVVNGNLKAEYIEEKALTLFIPQYYYGLLCDEGIDETTKTYVKQNMERAKWLFRNIEERKQNMLKIASSILDKQSDFVKYGKSYMKSMTQKEVASALGISVSTVSRIVNGKYIDTPRGIYELKYFFSSGTSHNQEDISAVAIKSKMRELIDGENKNRPLSDEKIKAYLVEWDIEVSRRTVAKYRTALQIPNASKRKEL